MPRLREGPNLRARAGVWTAGLAAGAALAAAGALLSRWCAAPASGWTLVLAAAAAGAAGAAFLAAPADEAAARAWALAAGLAALLIPAVLRVVGLGLASAAALQSPLGGPGKAAFVLAQAAALTALAAAAWTQALRAEGRRAAAAVVVGAAAAFAAARACEASLLLAGAGLAAAAAALLGERPWAADAPSRLRARAFMLAAGVALALADAAPGLLRDVWTARLHAAYPGGRFLSYADDGTRVWSGYEYSDRSAAALRDGVIQSWDPLTTLLVLRALAGQRENSDSLLIVDAPDPRSAVQAQHDGMAVALSWNAPAQGALVDALGGKDWRAPLTKSPPPEKPGAALVYLPRPASGADRRAAAGRGALTALKARLADGAAAAVLIPPDTAARTAAAVLNDAAAAFGHARAADLPNGGVLVLASPAEPVVDAQAIFSHLPLEVRIADEKGAEVLAAGVKWREAPSAK